jgi:hypothetical protein
MSIKIPDIGVYSEIHNKYKIYTTEKNITNKKGEELFRFSIMADMLIMAALMGFYLDQFKPFTKDDKIDRSTVSWEAIMSNDSLMHIVKSICLLHIQKNPKDASILLDNEKMAKIIEGYANGGIHHLLKELEAGVDLDGNLINILQKYTKKIKQ